MAVRCDQQCPALIRVVRRGCMHERPTHKKITNCHPKNKTIGSKALPTLFALFQSTTVAVAGIRPHQLHSRSIFSPETTWRPCSSDSRAWRVTLTLWLCNRGTSQSLHNKECLHLHLPNTISRRPPPHHGQQCGKTPARFVLALRIDLGHGC